MPHVMEYNGKNIVIPRMTEIVATTECEARAYLHPVNTGATSWHTMSNAVALAGTIGHHRIENYIRKQMGLSKLELELDKPDLKLFNDIMLNKEGKEWLEEYLKTAFNNYLEWHHDFQPTYLVPEITMTFVKTNDDGDVLANECVKGTVDLICELDPAKMSDRAKKIVALEEPSTIMLDWKTGMAKLSSHHAQLDGYDWLLDVSGKRIEIEADTVTKPWAKIDDTPVALCVRLGGSFGYMADAYLLDKTKFKAARDLFMKPNYIAKTRNEKYGDRVFREGYHCVFCTYRDNGCPIFSVQMVTLEELI